MALIANLNSFCKFMNSEGLRADEQPKAAIPPPPTTPRQKNPRPSAKSAVKKILHALPELHGAKYPVHPVNPV
jgi:hypothetical protein